MFGQKRIWFQPVGESSVGIAFVPVWLCHRGVAIKITGMGFEFTTTQQGLGGAQPAVVPPT
ncbi:MAG: hypothetical protein AAF497_29515 [Planctomycetota bacterium]